MTTISCLLLFASPVVGFLGAILFEVLFRSSQTPERFIFCGLLFYGFCALTFGLQEPITASLDSLINRVEAYEKANKKLDMSTKKMVLYLFGNRSLPISFTGIFLGWTTGYLLLIYRRSQRDELKDGEEKPYETAPGYVLINKVIGAYERRNKSDDTNFRIGEDTGTGEVVSIPVDELNRGCAVTGTTGSGKTNTLRVLLREGFKQSLPIVYVDCKPDPEIPDYLKAKCEEYGREFKHFDLTGTESVNYNFLKHGSNQAKVDKVLDLFEFSEEARVYRNRAENYLMEVLRAIDLAGETPDIHTLYNLTDKDDLLNFIDEKIESDKAEELIEQVRNLNTSDGASNIRTELRTLARSDYGELLRSDPEGVDLEKSLRNYGGPVTLFTVAGLELGSSAQTIGEVIIRDLKSVLGQFNGDVNRLFFIDEYHKIATEATAEILSMGRGYGLCSVISSQLPEDFGEGDITDRVLGNSNVKIVHRISSSQAEIMADERGTHTEVKQTKKLEDGEYAGEGSEREVEQYKFHPNTFKNLRTGQAVVWYGNEDEGYEGKVQVDFESQESV